MAITTYSDLQTAIADFLARTDLTNDIKNFISLAEARMSRELSTRSQEKRVTASTVANDEFISLPTDLREIRVIKLNSSPQRVLEYYTPQQFYKQFPNAAGGKPAAYTIIGTEVALRPVPSAAETVEMIYGEGITALSDSAATNTILTRHPDAYLYGSLTHAYTFLMDEGRAQTYDQYFGRSIEEITKEMEKSRFGGGGLAMQSEYIGA
tara:strand:- start:867 stop:1493 length:627 start_codon:yes stop_codon:yes gene_type:complete